MNKLLTTKLLSIVLAFTLYSSATLADPSGDPIVTSGGSTALGVLSTTSPILGAISSAELVYYCVHVRRAIDTLDTIGCAFDKAGELVQAPNMLKAAASAE